MAATLDTASAAREDYQGIQFDNLPIDGRAMVHCFADRRQSPPAGG
jgi:hypothetical protein